MLVIVQRFICKHPVTASHTIGPGLVFAMLFFSEIALGQESGGNTNQSSKQVSINQSQPSKDIREESPSNSYQLFPVTQLYPRYIADPLRNTFSAQTMFFSHTDIANTSRRRFDLKLGGPLGLIRLTSDENPERAMQLVLDVGFHGQFDADQSEDNIGWEGIYALYLTLQQNRSLFYRIGVRHFSSHVGDELMERTGRQRINYTRQELRLGITWQAQSHTQIYSDIGWGYDLRNKTLQKPWRLQVGAQYEKPHSLWNGKIGWYTAMDFSSYEENSWDINTTIQTGILFPSKERRWRIGIEHYNGRSQIGEFFQNSESYIGIAVWLDI